jgi:hypothetical protein
VSKIDWNTSEPPKDRRTLMIVTPAGATQPKQDVVIGDAREAYVQVAIPDEVARGFRPGLNVSHWAEIDLPPGINLRPLAAGDTHG